MRRIIAPDKLEGYTFGIRHALFELIKNLNDDNCLVGVEYYDDTSVENGNVVELNQLKSSTSNNEPLTNYSEVFWKALYNWSNYISESKKPKDQKYVFRFIVSANHKAKIGSIPLLFDKSHSTADALLKLKEAEKILNDADSKALKNKYVKYCLDNKNSSYMAYVIEHFEICYYEPGSYDNILKCNFYNQYDGIDENIFYLTLGWLHEYCHIFTSKNESPIIPVSLYKEKLNKFIEHSKTRAYLKILSSEPLKNEINDIVNKEPMFIKQLEIIEMDEADIFDATSKFLRTKSEIIMQANIGNDYDYNDFRESIINKWNAANTFVSTFPNLDDIIYGKRVYSTTKDYVENIRINGCDTPSFFNIGYSHIMSNELVIGWHKHYLETLSEGEKDE